VEHRDVVTLVLETVAVGTVDAAVDTAAAVAAAVGTRVDR
jgi:hypothetical protein